MSVLLLMAQSAAKPQTRGGGISTETTEAATTTRSRKRRGVGNIRTTHVQLLFVVFSCSYIIIIKAFNSFVVLPSKGSNVRGREAGEA